MINLTEKAAKEIKKVMEEQGMKQEDTALRIGVTSGGCSGFSYALEFIDKKDIDALNDDQLTFFEVQTVVDRKSLLYLDETTVDFIDDLNQRGFKFNNPQSTKSCGCGSSFSCG